MDAGQVERLRRWAPASEVWIYDGAEHVCTDRFGELLPRLGDWLVGRLSTRRVAAGRTA